MAVRGSRTASLTSDSGGAPENFHITYSHDGTDDDEAMEAAGHDGDLLSASSFQIGGGLVVPAGNTLRCPLCGAHRRQFHCKSCIRHGDFQHTATTLYNLPPERFGEKQQRLHNLRTANATLEAKGTRLLAKHFQAAKLAGEIKQRTDRANIIRKTIELKRTSIDELRAKQRTLTDDIRKLRIKLPRYDDKVKNLSEFVSRKLEESEHRKAQLAAAQDRLRLLKRDQIEQLVRYIFPITQTIVSRSQLASGSGGGSSTATSSSSGSGSTVGHGNTRSTINEISDATRTAYVRGQWVLQDSFGEVQHIIVAPALPGTGNYAAYTEWTAGADGGGTVSVLDHCPTVGSENPHAAPRVGSQNPAHTIAAALTYTTQLVNLMAFYLDVLLPFRVTYADFCTSTLPEAQFNRKVARLNADIVHLCHTQGCRLNDMNPTHTLANLLCLLKSPDLGLCGPTDRTSCLSESMDQLLVQRIGEDSDSEDETIIHQEWEAVPSNLSPVSVEQPLYLQPLTSVPLEHRHHGRIGVAAGGVHYPSHGLQQQPAASGAAAASLMTSAFASVSSFWKGWTGK